MATRIFYLLRNCDESGVSGTGIVAEGCVFTNGKAAMMWVSRGLESLVLHESLENIERIHGHGGKTRIIFADDLDRDWILNLQKIGVV